MNSATDAEKIISLHAGLDIQPWLSDVTVLPSASTRVSTTQLTHLLCEVAGRSENDVIFLPWPLYLACSTTNLGMSSTVLLLRVIAMSNYPVFPVK